MADPDAVRAGGATGALSRATQLANLRAANARRTADLLRRQRAQQAANQRMLTRNQGFAGGGEGYVLPRRPPPRKLPPPPKAGPSRQPKARADQLLGLVPGGTEYDALGNPVDQYGNPLQGPGIGRNPNATGFGGLLDIYTSPDQESVPDTTTPRVYDKKTGKLGAPLPGTAGPGYVGIADWQGRDPKEIDRYLKLSPKEQAQVRKNLDEARGPGQWSREEVERYLSLAEEENGEEKAAQYRRKLEGDPNRGKWGKTVKQMLDDMRKDPIQDSERFLAGQELADAFREESQSRYFTDRDITENPFLATLNELSAWSTYRLKVSEWKANKGKTGGSVGLLGESGTDDEDAGDGTFTGITDNGSFSSVTSPSNLSPYIMARDENGLLQVVTADQWIQAKFARMNSDPEYAAQMITALAMTSAYGSDSTANSQRSRVVVDRNGNPVKAFVSSEDLSALKKLANQVAILQNQGDEVAIDDSIAELTAIAAEVGQETTAAGDYGSGGGGYGGGWGGGYGGGGGGGGQSVQLTDATELTSLASSIARQRMGRELTPEEAAAFVSYYHGLERQESANYYAGGEFTRLDPEGQAVAWITSKFEEDAAANQYGNLAFELFNMMGGNPFGGLS